MTRETARLKGKLTGSKRTREEEDVAPPKPFSDDEEESKVGAIKKKPRPDPFDAISGKKTKKEKNLSTEERPSLPATSVSSSSNDVRPVKVEEEPLTNGIALAESTPSKRKKKRKKTIHNQEEEDPAGSLDEPTFQPLDDRPKSPVNESSGDLPIPSTPTRQVRASKWSSIVLIEQYFTPLFAEIEPLDQPLDVAFMGTPTVNPTSPRKTLPVDLLKTPLLNLNGPLQSDPESDADPTESPTSPKKKRRRKKKKKHPTGAPEASQSNSLPTPVAQ